MKGFSKICRDAGVSKLSVAARYAWMRARGKNLMCGPRTTIRGVQNIVVAGFARVGIDSMGFMTREDATVLRVDGRLTLNGRNFISRGCRMVIHENAKVDIHGSFLNGPSTYCITRGLSIGSGCVISWGCTLIDSDLHSLKALDGPPRPESAPIFIGDHVWIGCNVTILKGARIPSGCVIAAGAIVTKAFDEPCTLLAGSPAKIIRQNVEWS